MKTCFKCGARKLLTDFYPHSQMADGRLGKCKDCARRDVRQNRALRLEYYRAYDRSRAMEPHRVEAREAYARTPEGRLSHQKALDRQRVLRPDKYKARVAFRNAVRDGRVRPQPCERCGDKAHGHHEDYLKPLEVVWLCSTHHRERHKELEAMGVVL